MRLGIVASHPVQYQVPWYRALAKELDLTVYYALIPTREQQGVGFGEAFAWDVPLLDGYRWIALPNAARAPSLDGFLASRTPAVADALRADRPDAVIVSGWHALPLLQAMRACGRLGIPCLVRGESSGLRDRPWWARTVHRRLLSHFDAFLAIGAANRQFYRRNRVPEERIFSVPYFTDNDRFAKQDARWRPERDAIRRGWGIAADEACFLFAGKLVPKKRPLDFLAAYMLARERVSGIRALVVGSGELLGEARSFAAAHALEVAFAGFLNQTEISRAYVAADMLVLPSDYSETWGLVVNEAMVHGLPAIVSDRVGCGPDLVEDGVTGRTFPFGDVRALAHMMVDAAIDPDRLCEMGRQARRRVQGYSAERAVEGTLAAVAFVTSQSVGSGV